MTQIQISKCRNVDATKPHFYYDPVNRMWCYYLNIFSKYDRSRVIRYCNELEARMDEGVFYIT